MSRGLLPEVTYKFGQFTDLPRPSTWQEAKSSPIVGEAFGQLVSAKQGRRPIPEAPLQSKDISPQSASGAGRACYICHPPLRSLRPEDHKFQASLRCKEDLS